MLYKVEETYTPDNRDADRRDTRVFEANTTSKVELVRLALQAFDEDDCFNEFETEIAEQIEELPLPDDEHALSFSFCTNDGEYYYEITREAAKTTM